MEIETQSYITNLLKTNPKIVENNLNYNDKKFNECSPKLIFDFSSNNFLA